MITPGPWAYSKCRCGNPVCKSFVIDHSGPEGMFEEDDARLIVAAPDLRDALRSAIRTIHVQANIKGAIAPGSILAELSAVLEGCES